MTLRGGDSSSVYEMLEMRTKIEGCGYSSKTTIVNMVELAEALGRPPFLTTRYICTELHALSLINEKIGVFAFSGEHEIAILVGIIKKFIKEFVECHNCEWPRTNLVIKKSLLGSLVCCHCGSISDVGFCGDLVERKFRLNPSLLESGEAEHEEE